MLRLTTSTVAVFRGGAETAVLVGEGRASAAPALTDFALDVAALFSGLAD